jgi:hypothetical protein
MNRARSILTLLMKTVFLALLLTLFSFAISRADTIPIPRASEILGKVQPEHPRLLATRAEFDALRHRLATEPVLAEWYRRLRGDAEKLLSEPPAKYEIPDGLRLLSVSRRVLYRIQLLGLMHQTDRDNRWRDRAWQELSAAAAFPDWNTRHFLDTAEMTHAFAIGYDWFFDEWTVDQRTTLRRAMVEKALQPALDLHRRKSGWTRVRHNWNQVCNGGISMGALALASEEAPLAGELLESALQSIQLPMAEFAPDGAWAEGPGYWNYATSYNVVFLAALESALGTDFGLSQMPGFADAGLFPLYVNGPLDRTFNYADGGDGAIKAPHLFWLARKFHRPAFAAYQARLAAPHPLDLLWFDAALVEKGLKESLPLDRHFRDADVVTMRSAWQDRRALFLGFKAGDNKANHSHLDLGSFVFDALGCRWAMDLGADNYNLPGFFGKQRWTYYRLRAEGQNVLVLNPSEGPGQDPAAAGRIERFESGPEKVFAIADLSAAYAKQARSVRRGIALRQRRELLVQDEVEAERPIDAWWFMHTPAEIQIAPDGRRAELKQGSEHLLAELLSPADAKFESRPAAPLPGSPNPEGQNANAGIQKLTVHVQTAGALVLLVRLVPQSGDTKNDAAPPFPVLRLAEW